MIHGANDVFGCNGALLPSDFEIDMTLTAKPVQNVLTKGENSESRVEIFTKSLLSLIFVIYLSLLSTHLLYTHPPTNIYNYGSQM